MGSHPSFHWRGSVGRRFRLDPADLSETHGMEGPARRFSRHARRLPGIREDSRPKNRARLPLRLPSTGRGRREPGIPRADGAVAKFAHEDQRSRLLHGSGNSGDPGRKVFAIPRGPSPRRVENSAQENPANETARAIGAGRALACTGEFRARRLRRRLLATDRRRHEIWRPDRRERAGETAHPKFLQLVFGEARSRVEEARLPPVLRRISGSPVHARFVVGLFGKGRYFPRARAKLFIGSRSLRLPRRRPAGRLRRADLRRAEKSGAALPLL